MLRHGSDRTRSNLESLLMKTNMSKRVLVPAAIILFVGITVAIGQPAPNAPAAGPGGGGGRGGGGRGGGGTPGLGAPAASLWIPGGAGRPNTDVELTEMTRFDERMEAPTAAHAAANAVFARAVFATPANPAAVAASLKNIAEADLALAMARVAAIQSVREALKSSSPERVQSVVQSLGTGGGGARGGGRGGGGGRGAPGGAPGGPGGVPPGAPGAAPAGQ